MADSWRTRRVERAWDSVLHRREDRGCEQSGV